METSVVDDFVNTSRLSFLLKIFWSKSKLLHWLLYLLRVSVCSVFFVTVLRFGLQERYLF